MASVCSSPSGVTNAMVVLPKGGTFNYTAPTLAHTALPLEGFRALVRMGLNDMPAYKEQVLSDLELADIHAYLRSLPGPRPAKDIPQLNP